MTKQIPSPPPNSGIVRCRNCTRWLSSEKQTFYLDMNGQLTPANVADIPGGAILDLGHTTKVELSPCTLNPAWMPTAADHWCWQSYRAPSLPINPHTESERRHKG